MTNFCSHLKKLQILIEKERLVDNTTKFKFYTCLVCKNNFCTYCQMRYFADFLNPFSNEIIKVCESCHANTENPFFISFLNHSHSFEDRNRENDKLIEDIDLDTLLGKYIHFGESFVQEIKMMQIREKERAMELLDYIRFIEAHMKTLSTFKVQQNALFLLNYQNKKIENDLELKKEEVKQLSEKNQTQINLNNALSLENKMCNDIAKEALNMCDVYKNLLIEEVQKKFELQITKENVNLNLNLALNQ